MEEGEALPRRRSLGLEGRNEAQRSGVLEVTDGGDPAANAARRTAIPKGGLSAIPQGTRLEL